MHKKTTPKGRSNYISILRWIMPVNTYVYTSISTYHKRYFNANCFWRLGVVR